MGIEMIFGIWFFGTLLLLGADLAVVKIRS